MCSAASSVKVHLQLFFYAPAAHRCWNLESPNRNFFFFCISLSCAPLLMEHCHMTNDERTCGIPNPGSLCYLISVVQQLFAIPRIRDAFLDLELAINFVIQSVADIEEYPDKDMNSSYAETINELVLLFRNLQNNVEDIDITKLYFSLQKSLKKDIDIFKPRDASECFGDICKAINLFFSTPLIKLLLNQYYAQLCYYSPIEKVLYGELNTIIKPIKLDMDFDYSSMLISRSEKFHYLSLDIQSGNLIDGIKAFMKSQLFQFKWKLPNNECLSAPFLTEKKTVIQLWPQVLVIHLNRFTYSVKYKCKLKLFDFFEFPPEFSSEDVLADYSSAADADSVIYHKYKLSGVIVHIGETAYDGHYVAAVEKNGKWILFDDENTELCCESFLSTTYGNKYDEMEDSEDCSDADEFQTAFMLFYVKDR